MNIVKATKLAKKRKMGMVRKKSRINQFNGYLVPFEELKYGYGCYIPGDVMICWYINPQDALAKDWILVKRKEKMNKAFSMRQANEMRKKQSL